MPTSTSLATLMRRVCDALPAGGVSNPRTSTTTSAGAADGTTLIDSGLIYSGADTDLLGQAWIRIDSLVALGPASGSVSRLDAAGLTIASGALTVSPAFSAQVKSGTDYSIWKAVNPIVAKGFLNRAVRNKKRQVISPATLVADGDMEAAGVTNWTSIGAPSTKLKDTTLANVRYGTQSLHVIADAAGSGVRTGNYPCVQDRTWYCGAIIKVLAGTWTVAAYNATGPANIQTATSNQEAWQLIFFPFTTPSSSKNLQVRITGSALNAECYIDSVFLWPSLQVEYEPPSWLEDPKDIDEIGYYELRSSGSGTNYNYTPEEGEWVCLWKKREAEIDEASQHPFRQLLDRNIIRPLYIKARRPFTELSADTDTFTGDAEGIVLQTLWYIYDHLMVENADNEWAWGVWAKFRADVGERMEKRVAGSREGKPHVTVSAGRWTSY